MTQEASTRNGSYTNNFAYDGGSYTASTGAGNPTTMRGSTVSYNSNNQVSANTYDGNGNPISYASNTVGFDPENRMSYYGAAETNSYDGDNRRASIQTSSGTSYYVFDAMEPVLTEDNTGTVTKVVTMGACGVVSSHTSSTDFYTWDPQGSLCQKLNSSSTVQYTREYDAFGNVTKTDSDTDSYASFGGQWGYFTDTTTGLCQLGHRFYDPSTGRFVTRDPIGYAGGINVYAYCANNPINLADPVGNNAIAIIGIIACPECDVAILLIVVVVVVVVVLNNVQTPTNPGDSPGTDWNWNGKPGSTPGDSCGSWHNPSTGESLYPDFNHPPPIGPHWDYKPGRGGPKMRIPPGGNTGAFGPGY